MSSIAYTFGALTDARSYKPIFPVEKAFASLENMDATIDQNILDVFLEIFSSTQNEEKETDLVETVWGGSGLTEITRRTAELASP